ncbi:DUF128 domain-containing protein [Dehalococcoides mccartyi]|uniref:DUF128 domain-containing protein n=1 Tax=Dehalococcoides mccartyi TaxID=61435 RepID=UPI003395FDEB
MNNSQVYDVDRKIVSILKVLDNAEHPLGSRIIARNLNGLGIELSERAVRYHLRFMDERGLTTLAGRRDGRLITEQGQTELKRALVTDKVGMAFAKIEALAFQMTFDWKNRTGSLPVNVSLFQKDQFPRALKKMRPVFKSGLCVSELITVAEEGEYIGDMRVPEGKIALGTVCSVSINGAFLKAGIPVDSRFGGILQIQNRQPLRFTELIHYSGSSLDPSEIYIRAGMTSVSEAVMTGNGEILANFREFPAVCRSLAETVFKELKDAGIGGVCKMGNISETVFEIGIEQHRVGLILFGGMNPIAAAQESGIPTENYAMSMLTDYQTLINIDEL